MQFLWNVKQEHGSCPPPKKYLLAFLLTRTIGDMIIKLCIMIYNKHSRFMSQQLQI